MSSIVRTIVISLLFVAFAATHSGLYAQNNNNISLNVQDVPLHEALAQIEKQTNYRFLYNRNLVNVDKLITASLSDCSITDALNAILRDSDIAYTVKERQIVLTHSEMADQPTAARNITGAVRDQDGNVLVGVSVLVKDILRGAITNEAGNYNVSAEPEDILMFSFLGYEEVEIRVGNRSRIDVTMSVSAQEMEEVVVIGYGTARKKDLTGAVSSIQGNTVADRKTSQLSVALQGTMPGLTVTRTNSEPGAQSTLRVRGVTSINISDPLIIVDGVYASNINDINPNDVESITTLKDAASASIYGARAAAGVILITTKRATANRISLDYTFETGFDQATQYAENMGIIRFMETSNEMTWNDNMNDDRFPIYSEYLIENYMQLNAEDPDRYPNTDWRALMMRQRAPRQSHTFSLSGGTDKVRTKATLGYDNMEGLHINRSYERITVRMNNDVKINKFISGAFDINVKRSDKITPATSIINGMRIASPIYPAVWSDGRVASGKSGDNPYARLMYGGTSSSKYNQLGGKAAIYITPLEGVRLSAIISPTYNDSKIKSFTKRIEYYAADDPSVLEGVITDHASTNLSEGRNDSYNITKQFFLNYDKQLGSHNLSLMAGYEDFYQYYENLSAARDYFEISSYPYLSQGSENYQTNNASAYQHGYVSYFGRIMYNYKNKYLLQANVRLDGSSRFAAQYRWGTFPSVSGGWVVTEEKFFKNLNIKPLDYLKFRASYGTLGNERLSENNYWPYSPLMNFTPALFYNGNDIVSQLTAAQWTYAIENVTWETTKSLDFGLDITLLNDRLSITADYYYKITKDMLLSLEIPKYVGFENPDQNTGKMKTTGYEIEIGWRERKGEWSYGIAAHLSDFKSVMGYLGGTQFLGDQVKMQGSYFNEWYGYRTDGLFQTQEDVDASAKLNNNVQVGDIKYLAVDPEATAISPDKDRVLLGNSQPRYEYGGTFNLGYKGINLNVVVQGVGYQLCRIQPAMVIPLRDNWGNTPMLIEGRYWSHYNTEEQNLQAKYPRLSNTQRTYNYNTFSDFWLFNGAYFRLKNITLAYTLPARITEKASVKRLKIYASANDILCISNYPKGWDPEMGASAYPITSSLIFGININF